MTTPIPLISAGADDHRTLAAAIAARVAPHRPRLLGFGEPLHGEEEFGRLRNAVFAALVDQAGFTTIALETSAWHGRAVDAYVRGGVGTEEEVLAAGFTHGFGASPANRELVRWLREQNRERPPHARLRFAGFDAPTEMEAAPSPRPALRALHEFLSTHLGAAVDVAWDSLDRLLGPDAPWVEPAAVWEPARSIGADPLVRELRAITDDLRWILAGDAPGLRREIGPEAVEDALLAGRTAAGLLAYHAAMARAGDQRWQHLAALRDTMMAENLLALADRGPALVFAHNQHLRTGTTELSFDPVTLRWQPAGAHVADRLGGDYRVIACAFGDAPGHGIPQPAPDTVEGVLHDALPPGNHLLSAAALRDLGRAQRSSPNHAYIPLDDTVLGQVDELLFLRSIAPSGAPSHR